MIRLLRAIALVMGLATTPIIAAPPPPEFAKTVTFIFLADEQGNPRIHSETHTLMVNGTGFFVLVDNENGPGVYGYLVTAKHVLQDEQGEYFRRVFVRLNDKNNGSTFAPIDLFPAGENQNVFTHSDPTVDIAVIPALPDEKLFDFLGVPMSMIRTKEGFKETKMDREPGKIYAGIEITLAGVMRGNFNEVRVGSFIQTPNAVAPVIGQNVGIAAVTPAHLLRDVLFSDRLKKFRADNPIKPPEEPVKKPE